MEKKTIAPKFYVYNEGTTTLNNIVQYADTKVDAVYEEVQKKGLQPVGPIEFIYFGASADRDKEFKLQIGIPVAEAKPVGEGFAIKQSKDFNCLVEIHKGAMQTLGATYGNIYEYLWNNSLKTNEEIREIYHSFQGPDAAENVTEIQVGLL